MNLVPIAQFFEAVYTKIFKRLLVVRSIKDGLLRPVSTYFGMVKLNG